MTAWLAAAVVLAGGTSGVIAVGERRISERATANDRLAGQLAANEQIVRSRGPLQTERARLRADLDHARAAGKPAAAQFLREAADTVQRSQVTITAVAVPGASGPHVLASSTRPVDELTVTLEGRYADVLTVIRGLSLLRVPAGVEIVSIVRAARPGAAAVSAVLRITLLHDESLAGIDVQRRP